MRSRSTTPPTRRNISMTPAANTKLIAYIRFEIVNVSFFTVGVRFTRAGGRFCIVSVRFRIVGVRFTVLRSERRDQKLQS